MPDRIQRRRAKGWRMPENTVCVDRSTPWGNPFVVGRDGTREECVRLHRYLLAGMFCITTTATPEAQRAAMDYARANIGDLRGRNLACWCGPGPCHADTLLECAVVAHG